MADITLSFFNDLLVAIEKLAADVQKAANLPQQHRDKLREALESAYSTIDAALILVITRLGKIVERADRGATAEFSQELMRLTWDQEWLELESKLSLCSTLRRTKAEMSRLLPRTVSRLVVRDRRALDAQIDAILSNEYQLATYISARLTGLADQASAAASAAGFDNARNDVQATLTSLQAERRRLIQDEANLYRVI